MNIGVIGAGSWGTTLAAVLRENNHKVALWSYSAEDAQVMRSTRRNPDYLPDLEFAADITVTDDLSEAAAGRDLLVLSTPAQFMRSVLLRLRECITGRPWFVNVAKGIEKDTLLRMSELVREVLSGHDIKRYAVLSGPSHAEEVCLKKPTTLVVASADQDTSRMVQAAFMTRYLRVYGSADVIGVELGGSVKNVIAIGAGIGDGAALGDNAKAALITRGLAEMRRLGVTLGADPHTFAGLSGLGDLIVTTMSRHSRNRFVGEQIGLGRSLRNIIGGMKMVAEGVETTRSTDALARRAGVEMPITRQMHAILFEDKEPSAALAELMTRQARDEVW
jgi:glycerol-3-phosphate dehydrogenase (NAD(P)+)